MANAIHKPGDESTSDPGGQGRGGRNFYSFLDRPYHHAEYATPVCKPLVVCYFTPKPHYNIHEPAKKARKKNPPVSTKDWGQMMKRRRRPVLSRTFIPTRCT